MRRASSFVKAVQLQPQNPDTWLQLGAYDLQHTQPTEALADFHKVLVARSHLQPGDVRTRGQAQTQLSSRPPTGK